MFPFKGMPAWAQFVGEILRPRMPCASSAHSAQGQRGERNPARSVADRALCARDDRDRGVVLSRDVD